MALRWSSTRGRPAEACEAYIASQRGKVGFKSTTVMMTAACPAATLDRPALKRLRADIEAGSIHIVVSTDDRLSVHVIFQLWNPSSITA